MKTTHLTAAEQNTYARKIKTPQELREILGRPLRQYRPPLAQEDRPVDGTPDLGAYEYVP